MLFALFVIYLMLVVGVTRATPLETKTKLLACTLLSLLSTAVLFAFRNGITLQ
jgi:hypothetical protein